MFKKLTTMLLVLVMVISIGTPVFAAEKEDVASYDSSNISETESRIKGWDNILVVKAIDGGANKVKVSIQNIGLDWVDKVSMRVRIYNQYGLQYDQPLVETTILQMLPRNNSFSITGWTKIILSNIVGEDEGDVGNLPDVILEK